MLHVVPEPYKTDAAVDPETYMCLAYLHGRQTFRMNKYGMDPGEALMDALTGMDEDLYQHLMDEGADAHGKGAAFLGEIVWPAVLVWYSNPKHRENICPVPKPRRSLKAA